MPAQTPYCVLGMQLCQLGLEFFLGVSCPFSSFVTLNTKERLWGVGHSLGHFLRRGWSPLLNSLSTPPSWGASGEHLPLHLDCI